MLRTYADTWRLVWFLVVAVFGFVLTSGHATSALDRHEVLRYELTWNGAKAGHGDITTKTDSRVVTVTAQAVSDGALKTLIELWTRAQATFTAGTLLPQVYNFALKSNLGSPELVNLVFDHENNLVQVNKQRGSEQESHSERFQGMYDPITAVFVLRSQKDFRRPVFVNIYDGKDKARLEVAQVGTEPLQLRTGVHPAICLTLRLQKLSGDKSEIGTGKLWISDDRYRIPLLLTASPIVGTIRCELVDSKL
jgi:hypothetical protein